MNKQFIDEYSGPVRRNEANLPFLYLNNRQMKTYGPFIQVIQRNSGYVTNNNVSNPRKRRLKI